MIDLGIVRPGRTIRIPFSSFDKDDGSSITMTNYAAADILVYKDGSTTERASTAGYTATTDFDSKTGKHVAIIDLADNTTADFWNAGAEYMVAIDAVTVDAVTTGGWIARFIIGYPSAILNTTIASLSSQTSFTLTSGPAEDDALNGMWAVIHDIASAVQLAKVLILDYTGATKTVTLAAGATFTAAAGDNFSVMDMAPLQPSVTGATTVAQTGDAYAIVNSGTHGNAALKTLIDAIDDFVDTEVAAIFNRIGAPAGATIAADLATIAAYIDTEIAAIFNRIGAPVGASISADIAGVQSDTNDIQTRIPAALTADGNMKSDALRLSGSATAADNLEAGALGLVSSTCAAGSTTTSIVTNLTEATDDHYNGRVITFTSGALAGQSTSISDYNGTTKTLTVVQLTEAPADTDAFVIS